jgi:hypothetical protein
MAVHLAADAMVRERKIVRRDGAAGGTDGGDLCSIDRSRSFRQQQEESTMRKLAMSFLSELSGAWLKRRLTAAVPVKTAQPRP